MSFTNPLIKKYSSLLKAINSDSFVGEDVRYSSSFEEVESMLSGSASLFSSTATDWQKVTELAEKILTTQSKDIRVLCWFTWALFKTDSFTGLQAGINLINELVSKHWEVMFPAKQRTRVSAFEWLTTRIEQLFQESFAVKEQLPLFKALLAELLRLDSFLTEKWQDDSPLILPTCRRIEKMISEAGEVADQNKDKSVVGKVINQAKEIVTGTITPQTITSSIDNERDANKLLRNLQDNSRTLCIWWLSQRATDIKALRLNRTLLWIAIESLPDHKDDITTLRPVPVDKVNNYKERLAQGRYSDLILDVEVSISKAPFWLDGQHMVWQCLHALRMDAAMLELEVQLALFLQRIPRVIELKFHDGTPFANESTVAWINDHVLPRLGNQTGHINAHLVASDSSHGEWEEALQESIATLSSDGLKDSMKPLLAGLKAASGGREKFFWQLCMAKLCFANKKYELAKTQLENLDEHIHRLGIEQWEPALVLEVVYLLYRCCELLPQSQHVREAKDILYKRLCFLDMDLIVDESQ